MGLPSPLIAMNALWRSFLGRNYSPATDNTAYDTESLPPLPITGGGTGADSAIKAVPNLFPNSLTDKAAAYEFMARLVTDGKPGRVTVADLKQILGVVQFDGYTREETDAKLKTLADKINSIEQSGGIVVPERIILDGVFNVRKIRFESGLQKPLIGNTDINKLTIQFSGTTGSGNRLAWPGTTNLIAKLYGYNGINANNEGPIVRSTALPAVGTSMTLGQSRTLSLSQSIFPCNRGMYYLYITAFDLESTNGGDNTLSTPKVTITLHS